jgi:hypothetical protein
LDRVAAALLSVLMPGVGQMYNRQFIKGIIFMIIEHYDNIFACINQALYLDLNGFHRQALHTLNFQYAPFYAGFYVYTVWDALYFAKPNGDRKSIFIFILAGFIGVIMTLFSPHLPMPAITIGLSMLMPMIIGIILYRK